MHDRSHWTPSDPDETTDLLGLTREECEALAVSLGYRAFHGRNLFKWIHKHGVRAFDRMTDLPKSLRADLGRMARVEIPPLHREQRSADGTRKWLLALRDGQRVETVLIPETQRTTLCISSQVGCALDCQFCATARQGFNRNLTVAEIVAQVWHGTRQLGAPPSNVVFMGMGEPLANLDAVVKAIAIIRDDLSYMISRWRITLSTAGIVPGIRRLGTLTDVSLAVSLHAPEDALRDELVPINRKYPLATLIPACRAYLAGEKRRRITWEYIMLRDRNDSPRHAKQLIRLLAGTPSKVNLIPFNPFPGTTLAPSPWERIETFRELLVRSGLFTTIRKTRGDEIAAACGQLVGRVQDRTGRQMVPAPSLESQVR